LAARVAEGEGATGSVLEASKAGLLVACADGALLLTRVQLPGGKPLDFADLFNSRREKFSVGTVLGVTVDAQ
jgi:methionyl-tRNA formyltransferase